MNSTLSHNLCAKLRADSDCSYQILLTVANSEVWFVCVGGCMYLCVHALTRKTAWAISSRLGTDGSWQLLAVPIFCAYLCILCFCFSYCIYVVLLSAQWGGFSGIEAQSLGPLFLQCFDAVGSVFWPIKPVPDMTNNVFGGTLNLAQFNPDGQMVFTIQLDTFWHADVEFKTSKWIYFRKKSIRSLYDA